jgi:hypothetical protein
VKGYAAIAWTLALVFVVAAGSKFLDLGGSIFGTDSESLKAIIDAGAAALIAFVVNWAAPWVDRYGVGKM